MTSETASAAVQAFDFAVSNWSGLASVATVVGIAGIAIAWSSYQSNIDNMASARMHGLFADYLKLRIEWGRGPAPSSATDSEKDQKRRLTSFKLYILEEIYLWTERRRRSLPILFNRYRRAVEIRTWRETIAFHLKEDLSGSETGNDSVVSITNALDCYGPGFLGFACLVFGEPIRMAAQQSKARSEIIREYQMNLRRAPTFGPFDFKACP